MLRGAEDARRVHEHVEAAEAVDRLAHAGVDGLLVGDVEHRGGEALADALGVGELGGADQAGLVDVDGVHGAGLLQEPEDGGPSDPRASARHDDAPVLEPLHVRTSGSRPFF